MRSRPTLLQARLRGFIAALMVVTLSVVSFSAVFARAAQASPAVRADIAAIAAVSGPKTLPVKICHRMVLPGTTNTCPLSSFSFGTVFGASDELLLPPASVTASWRLSNSSLPPQQFGPGLYRPPRALV